MILEMFAWILLVFLLEWGAIALYVAFYGLYLQVQDTILLRKRILTERKEIEEMMKRFDN